MQGRVARGFLWTILDVWGRQLLNLVVFIVLANLLVPEDFGLVALAAVFVAFAQVVVDQGLGDALIQRREVRPEHIDTAFWTAVGTGLLLTGIGQLVAGPAAALLATPRLEEILRVLSLTFVLSAMTNIQMALLRRQLAFRSLAIRTFLAVAAGGTAGIALALADYGAWALVGQQLVAALVSVATLWWVLPWRPSRRFSGAAFRELYAFGVRVVGSDVLTFLSRNTDNLLIGIVLGIEPLGLYAVGYRILETTQQLLISITRKVTFPALASLQADPGRMLRAFFRLSRAGATVIMPGYVAMALVAPELTVVLFGPRWGESGVVAAILFLSGPVLSIRAFSGPLLYAAGAPGSFLRFQLISAMANIVGFVIAVPFGIAAVAAAFTIRGYLLLPVNLIFLRVYAGVPIGDYLRQLRGVAFATAAMATVMLGIRILFGAEFSNWGLVVVAAIAGGLSYVGALWLLDGALLGELLGVARDVIPGRRRRDTHAAARERPADPADD